MAQHLPLETATAEHLQRKAAQRANRTQNHKHTATCAKNGGAPNDDDCRLGVPVPAEPSTRVEGSGMVHLQRKGTMMVPYIQPLMLSNYSCNHAIYLAGEGGR